MKKHLEELNSYVTENRLKNVISKIGKITDKDFGVLSKAFFEDIKEEFIKEHGGQALSILNIKEIKKVFTRNYQTLLRNNFLNIIDGNF